MVKKFYKGGIRFYYGDYPVGDVDLRHFYSGGPALLLGEIKWSQEEILKHHQQKWNFQQIVDFLHPYIWVVYIIGRPIGIDNELQCERFFRVVKWKGLEELEFFPLLIQPGNLGPLLNYFRKTCVKEIAEYQKQAANDNSRIVPDYGKRRAA
jgi:hypothetical protein